MNILILGDIVGPSGREAIIKKLPNLIKKKKILKIGLAFSVQKINNVPVSKYDKKLDYIVTDKYIL